MALSVERLAVAGDAAAILGDLGGVACPKSLVPLASGDDVFGCSSRAAAGAVGLGTFPVLLLAGEGCDGIGGLADGTGAGSTLCAFGVGVVLARCALLRA